MRLLFAVAHFFDRTGDERYGSTSGAAGDRLSGLARTIAAVHQAFGAKQYIFDWDRGVAFPANDRAAHHVDVVVCTTGTSHLLDGLSLNAGAYAHHETEADPMLLGFECQAVLREALHEYDYYCYLEDDIVLDDPWFFAKLRWFSSWAGEDTLLQPNRFESDSDGRKLYIDGDVPAHLTAGFQTGLEEPPLVREFLGEDVEFRRVLNPHAGCYFLNDAQMSRWTEQPYFLDRDISFWGPLESAATLGIMRTFRTFKAAPPCAAFLEVRHQGVRYISELQS